MNDKLKQIVHYYKGLSKTLSIKKFKQKLHRNSGQSFNWDNLRRFPGRGDIKPKSKFIMHLLCASIVLSVIHTLPHFILKTIKWGEILSPHFTNDKMKLTEIKSFLRFISSNCLNPVEARVSDPWVRVPNLSVLSSSTFPCCYLPRNRVQSKE